MATTLNGMILESMENYAALPALKIRDGEVFKPITYRELGQVIQKLGTGLLDIGIGKGDRVGLISDNRYEWIMCDLAILGTGACDVPRGSDSTPKELEYILRHAEIGTAFVENRSQLDKVYAIAETLPDLKNLVLIENPGKLDRKRYRAIRVHTMQDLIEKGEALLAKGDHRFLKASRRVKPDDLATIIYTSGTTGEPKGVMLTHRNIMHNAVNSNKNVPITTGDRFLSILPAWHSFERSVEYVLLYVGASNAYSKPTAQVLLKDFETEKPNYITSVPRIWESLHSAILYKIGKESAVRRALFHLFVWAGIRRHKSVLMLKNLMPRFSPTGAFKRLFEVLTSSLAAAALKPAVLLGDKLVYAKIREKTGGELKAGISGGGALPSHVDDFFAGVGLTVLEGYGLTETSPIVAVRTFERPVPYTVGQLLPEVEVKIVDESGAELPRGMKGIIMVRGPLVMKGYYRNRQATEQVLHPDGWLNTGDLGRFTLDGELQITGRAKDTIVLLGGENVEPLPIEQKLGECALILQAMVVGQDRKKLGALIVPNFESLKAFAETEKIPFTSVEALLEDERVIGAYRQEIRALISHKNGFKTNELLTTFKLLPREFEVGKELTHTLKMKRNLIADMFGEHIEAMYR
jgi:long-chain acyl-CoA synthetase